MQVDQILKTQAPLIVDVREPFEFATGHVAGAENIPLGQIPGQIDRFRHLGKPIVFYCRSGMRSGQAVSFLKGVGVHDIYNGGSLEEMQYIMGVPA